MQQLNMLAGIVGGVVRGLQVVVLVGLVCASLVSVPVPHFPCYRCYMYWELSVIVVSLTCFCC